MKLLTRREFANSALIISPILLSTRNALGDDLLVPLYLRLVRRTGWEELMGRNQCIISDLYVTTTGFPMADRGRHICNGLELPWRGNNNQISSIPAGLYEGFVRTDGPRGWRIELLGTDPRSNIQLHVGNTPENSIGCVLLGTGDSSDAQCRISGSKDAVAAVRAEYGENTSRKTALMIQSF
jgi:hypothetical protein